MTALQANCPACGAELIFKNGSSIVVVCEYCNSAVARTDRALEDLGKVAEIVESGSPLDVGLTGTYRGVAFELTGRAQLGHAAGGIWDEWYAAFANGGWGWLAEAQGRFYLTFKQELPAGHNPIPPFDALELGEAVTVLPGAAAQLMVAEKGEAQARGAKGEIPYRLVPGETYLYADLSGQNGAFATIDYGESPPLVYLGRAVTLDELGIDAAVVAAPQREMRRTAGVAQLQCPQCGGPLELRAPDRAERVTCPNCGSLLDVNQGKLQFLKTLGPKKYEPKIPLGTVGEFAGRKLTLIGYLVRSVEFEGTRYYWEEYLLYQPQVGFRWLVQSDNHWSYTEAVPPGEVADGEKKIKFRGQTFKVFQDAVARVEQVEGEFYWKVAVGEQARAVDFISPPQMLSKEISILEGAEGGKKRKVVGGEINWSLGTYLPTKDVEKAFGLGGPLPPPSTPVAPNQPFRHSGIYKYWAALAALAFIGGMFFLMSGARRPVFEQSYQLQPLAAADATQVIFSEPLDLADRQNIKVTASAGVDNSWLYLEGDFINEETGLVQQFDIPIEYYYGVQDGESWSEGGAVSDVHLSSLPAGRYTMRLEAQWDKLPPRLGIRVEQGVPRVLNLFLALVALSVIPLIILFSHYRFEKRRWEDSAFNTSGTADDDDDE